MLPAQGYLFRSKLTTGYTSSTSSTSSSTSSNSGKKKRCQLLISCMCSLAHSPLAVRPVTRERGVDSRMACEKGQSREVRSGSKRAVQHARGGGQWRARERGSYGSRELPLARMRLPCDGIHPCMVDVRLTLTLLRCDMLEGTGRWMNRVWSP